jgi:hypothetical protein
MRFWARRLVRSSPLKSYLSKISPLIGMRSTRSSSANAPDTYPPKSPVNIGQAAQFLNKEWGLNSSPVFKQKNSLLIAKNRQNPPSQIERLSIVAKSTDNAHRVIASDVRTRSKPVIGLYIYQYGKILMPLQKQVAEEQGFEPWEDFHPRRFSRPVHSTTLPLLRHALPSVGKKIPQAHF